MEMLSSYCGRQQKSPQQRDSFLWSQTQLCPLSGRDAFKCF